MREQNQACKATPLRVLGTQMDRRDLRWMEDPDGGEEEGKRRKRGLEMMGCGKGSMDWLGMAGDDGSECSI